jgi:hypothetical protein
VAAAGSRIGALTTPLTASAGNINPVGTRCAFRMLLGFVAATSQAACWRWAFRLGFAAWFAKHEVASTDSPSYWELAAVVCSRAADGECGTEAAPGHEFTGLVHAAIVGFAV